MDTVTIDHTKAEQFANRMLDMLNSSALMLMTSIGHRTGLFYTMKNLAPATSEHIAQSAGLNERYVREWLGAMVTGGVVEYYPDEKKYVLPVEYCQWLSREAAPNNIAVFAQYIPLLGSVEDNIIECFHKGGGVPYSAFERFQQVMAEDSGQTVVAALFDSILPLVPGLVERLEKGIDVLDVGCGSGRAVTLMAKTFHRNRFTGYDFTNDAIDAAKAEAMELGLTNVNFEQKDVTLLNEHNTYDLITAFDAIHDQAKPDVVLAVIAKALRQDGTFLMQDIAASSDLRNNIDHPVGPLLYTISCMHCMTVSLAQNGMGLGTMWGEEKAREMLSDAGFSHIETKKLAHDFQNIYYIIKKSELNKN